VSTFGVPPSQIGGVVVDPGSPTDPGKGAWVRPASLGTARSRAALEQIVDGLLVAGRSGAS
jgi:hypothetical protein